jgi:WhiB family redox-sensing transcriptional regulator
MTRINVRLAVCRPGGGYDPDLWYPTSDERTRRGRFDRAKAKAVCQDCPVQAACLAYALDAGEDAGVWGGATEAERRAMRRARRHAVTAGAPSGSVTRAAS